jgi:hypothetical protein
MALLEQFNKEKNCDLDLAFLNAESVIETCSQETFEIPNSEELKSLHLDEVIAECSQDYNYY